jgi:hypothetical protein
MIKLHNQQACTRHKVVAYIDEVQVWRWALDLVFRCPS